MGAAPYSYYVPFESNVDLALERLKLQVKKSNKIPDGELKSMLPDDVLADIEGGEFNTFFDLLMIGDTPDICYICPLSSEQLQEFFGTTQPTRQLIESNDDFYDGIQNGHGIYIIVYKNGKPDEYFFAGYTVD